MSQVKKQPIVQDVQESAKRQVSEVVRVGEDAVTSGAWMYPIQGIIYTISHPNLMKPLFPVILRAVLTSVGVLGAMFIFTYLPQVAVLAFVTGPLAFIGAVPLVLGESYIIIMFLTRTYLIGQASTDLFDAVLLSKNHRELVQKGRLSSAQTSSGGKITKLGKAITKPIGGKWFMSVDGVVRYVLSLPLNFIPVVGTVFFLGYNGSKAGPSYHDRYFQLKGYDKEKRKQVINQRRGAYTAFGTVAMALNIIPIVSVVFTLTTAVGAALWASELENKGKTGSVERDTEVTLGDDYGKKEVEGKKEL